MPTTENHRFWKIYKFQGMSNKSIYNILLYYSVFSSSLTSFFHFWNAFIKLPAFSEFSSRNISKTASVTFLKILYIIN